MTKAEQDAYYDDLVRNDPVLADLQRRNVHAFSDPSTRPADRSTWLSGPEYRALRDARLQELGIDPTRWMVQASMRGEITGADFQNWFERNSDALTKYGALGVFGLVGGNIAANVIGGGAGAAGGAAGGTGGAATAGGMGVADWILTGLGLAGTALDVFGNLQQGQAAKALAEFNARVARTQAADALARGAEEEARFRQGVRILVGQQRAGFAGQNVVVDVGSAADVVNDAEYLGELDAQTIRRNAAREAWGYEMQAQNYELGGDNAVTASRFNAAGAAIGGATGLLNSRYGFGRA